MSKLKARFDRLLANGERALVTFVTAGDPSLEDLPGVLSMLESAGSDVIEVGIPFSDPIADGPVIQASSQRALDRGVTPPAILDTLTRCRIEVPIVLMGYYNPILKMGLEVFADRAVNAGVSGVIVSDLTPEEAGPWLALCRAKGLDTIFLASPTSTDERLEQIANCSSGFVYAVSRTGVTGTHQGTLPDLGFVVGRIRTHTILPIAVGFGISRPDQVSKVCSVADGAVVGSCLVDQIYRTWDGGQGAPNLSETVRELKAATNLATR